MKITIEIPGCPAKYGPSWEALECFLSTCFASGDFELESGEKPVRLVRIHSPSGSHNFRDCAEYELSIQVNHKLVVNEYHSTIKTEKF